MTLRAALDDYKRNQGSSTRFPGERRTTDGCFSGLSGRAVHIGEDGSLRDFSYPLIGKYGIDRSRFGVRIDGDVQWLDGVETTSQTYLEDTALVRSTFENDDFTLERHDLTLGEDHITHLDVVEGAVDAVAVFVSFAPGGRDDRIGQLVHDERVVEVYHRHEHDFLASAPAFETVAGQLPERLPDVLDDEPAVYPNGDETGQYEDGRLGGYVLGFVPIADADDGVTILSRLSGQDGSASAVADRVRTFDSVDSLRRAAPSVSGSLDTDDPTFETIVDDLRVLDVLSNERGSRIAGPDFDPHFEYSGGYGYTWFRDDAEIARFLLESDGILDLGLDDQHEDSAAFYEAAQLDDGTWPHRVWPDDGSLAPGWANDRIGCGGVDYQADQSASVLSFVAAYAGTDETRAREVEPMIEQGLDGLDETLTDDGLPIPCQNAWENMAGQFTHTAATFLHAYASIAATPIDAALRDRASEQARAVFDGLDALWDDEREIYALRRHEGDLDNRLDSSTFALLEAHEQYAAIETVDDRRRSRLRRHIDTTLSGLYRETDEVAGLIRFEGDDWRTRSQSAEKIWTVSTAWGANAATTFAGFTGDDRYFEEARALLGELYPGGSLCLESTFLPEQVFDDGTPDSATPLGWPHALRLATVAQLLEADELAVGTEPSPASD